MEINESNQKIKIAISLLSDITYNLSKNCWTLPNS